MELYYACPEAANYPNECEFIKIHKHNLIVWKRHSKPLFQILTIFETVAKNQTKVVFKCFFKQKNNTGN